MEEASGPRIRQTNLLDLHVLLLIRRVAPTRVVQVTRFQLVINLKTAKTLGLRVPALLPAIFIPLEMVGCVASSLRPPGSEKRRETLKLLRAMAKRVEHDLNAEKIFWADYDDALKALRTADHFLR